MIVAPLPSALPSVGLSLWGCGHFSPFTYLCSSAQFLPTFVSAFTGTLNLTTTRHNCQWGGIDSYYGLWYGPLGEPTKEVL